MQCTKVITAICPAVFSLFIICSTSGCNLISKPVKDTALTSVAYKAALLRNYRQAEDEKRISHLHGLISESNPKVLSARDIATDILTISSQYKMDPLFIAAVIAYESRFVETAVSKAPAYGLMQVMVATAREVAQRYLTPKHIMDRKQNLHLGVKYLQQLLSRYSGNKTLALAAYNWGPAKVDRAQRRRGRIPLGVRKYANGIVQRNEIYSRSL